MFSEPYSFLLYIRAKGGRIDLSTKIWSRNTFLVREKEQYTLVHLLFYKINKK